LPRSLPLLIVALLLTGCLTPEQKMIKTVDRMMAQEAYDDALSYLERYLVRFDQSLAGWRYRVLIRLDQEERALAATEYAALNDALSRHEPDVLREVVLGAGGRWLISDYRALARCAPEGVADVAFFADRLQAKHLGSGSMTKVRVSADEVGAVIDALPGRLNPGETWPLVAEYAAAPEEGLRRRVVAAAGRHLASGELGPVKAAEALAVVEGGATSSEATLREQALISALMLPEGEGRDSYVAGLVGAFSGVGDAPRSVGLFLLGPGMAGPTAWPDELLAAWSADPGPLGIAALGQQALRNPKRAIVRSLEKRRKVADPASKLVSHAGLGDVVTAEGKADWKAADAELRRTWAPALIRTMAKDRAGWTAMILADSDALVTASAAAALGLPGAGDDRAIDAFLEHTMNASDPATRAAAAVAAVERGATGLALAVEGLVSRGDDRVVNDVLQAMVDVGDPAFQKIVATGLKAEMPLGRERAVDAAAASCLPEHRDLMAALLKDEDPHVAVRAASALYLLVGNKKSARPAPTAP
jgi:hypothetical protein